MELNFYKRKFKVFLADVSPDMTAWRSRLSCVLNNAGIAVVPDLQTADCSIHLLGGQDIYSKDGKGYNTPAGSQFRTAKTLCSKDFKMFVWNPSDMLGADNQYINDIRRDIVENTVYSDKKSPIIFVEDIRNIMNFKQQESRRSKATDIFFFSTNSTATLHSAFTICSKIFKKSENSVSAFQAVSTTIRLFSRNFPRAK